MPKKHQLLECKFNHSPAKWADEYARRFKGLGNYPAAGYHLASLLRDDIDSCLGMVCLAHLGYKVPVDTSDFLNRGYEVVIEYFCGDWWKGDKDSAREMNKQRKRSGDLRWLAAFSQGILLGLLSERWTDVAKVCSWVEADLRPDCIGLTDFEPELTEVYRSIAAGLRPEPMPGLEKLEKQLLKCRTLRPRLLFQAWDAARKGDQAGFEEALVKSLEHFSANYGSGPVAIDWVATHQSVVAMAAKRLGMKLPKLPPKLDAVLMTRESLRLPSSPK